MSPDATAVAAAPTVAETVAARPAPGKGRRGKRRGRAGVGPSGWRAAALLLVVTLAVFGRSALYDFIAWDDNFDIVENDRLCRLDLGYFWRNPYLGNYRPVQWLWYGMETYLSGRPDSSVDLWRPDGQVFHIGKLALHLLCGFAVWRLVCRLVENRWAATVGALVFLVHPLQVESVVWNADLGPLCALLTLWAIDAYLTATAAPTSQGMGAPWRRAAYYLLSLFLLAAALLTKQLALAAPLTLAALEFVWLQRGRQALFGLAPWFAVTLCGAVIAKLVQPDSEVLDVPPLWQRPLIAADSLAFYLQKLAWPSRLSLDYALTPRAALNSGQAYWSWLLPTVTAGLLLRWNQRAAWGAAALFVAGLAPSLGLVPFYAQNMSTVADRYAYLALLGPAMGTAALVAQSRDNARGAWRAAVAVIAVWIAISFWQVGYWRDSETLLSRVVDVAPRSFIGQTNLCAVLYRQNRLEEAWQHASQALEMRPDHAPTLVSSGAVLNELERYDEAAAWLTRAVDLQPNLVMARANLAFALLGQGRIAAARLQAAQALRLDGNSYWAQVALGRVAMAENNLALAEREFRQAIQLDPNSLAAYLGLGDLYSRQGALDDALVQFNAALRIVPAHTAARLGQADCLSRRGDGAAAQAVFDPLLTHRNPPRTLPLLYAEHLLRHGRGAESLTLASQAYERTPDDPFALGALGRAQLAAGQTGAGVMNLRKALQSGWYFSREPARELAWTLATHHDAALRNGGEALALMRQVLAANQPATVDELDAMAAAHAAAGEFQQALAIGRKALEAAKQNGPAAKVEPLQRRIALYELRQPYVAGPEGANSADVP